MRFAFERPRCVLAVVLKDIYRGCIRTFESFQVNVYENMHGLKGKWIYEVCGCLHAFDAKLGHSVTGWHKYWTLRCFCMAADFTVSFGLKEYCRFMSLIMWNAFISIIHFVYYVLTPRLNDNVRFRLRNIGVFFCGIFFVQILNTGKRLNNWTPNIIQYWLNSEFHYDQQSNITELLFKSLIIKKRVRHGLYQIKRINLDRSSHIQREGNVTKTY